MIFPKSVCKNKYMSDKLIFGHLSDDNISDEEILEMAKLQGKDPEELRHDIFAALADLKYSQKEISDTISKNNFNLFPDSRVNLAGFGLKGEFDDYFLCHDGADLCREYDIKDMALVTGFGPTNSPTAGTLSIIFRLLRIQKATGIYCHVIVSDLGALNSRRKSLRELLENAERFKRFIIALGFNQSLGELRSHNDLDMLRTASLTSSTLSISDFEDNKEATEDMYERLKIVGNDFSTMVDKNFTVADILMPIIRDQKKIVLVSAGLEEQYYPRLAREVIKRLGARVGLSEMVSGEPKIAAVYGRIIEGLFPYVKMSKSIPESAINIGSTIEEIEKRIISCGERNEHVILQMMELASDWGSEKLMVAQNAFDSRKDGDGKWLEIKREYLEFFLEIKNLWDKTEKPIDSIRKNIYK